MVLWLHRLFVQPNNDPTQCVWRAILPWSNVDCRPTNDTNTEISVCLCWNANSPCKGERRAIRWHSCAKRTYFRPVLRLVRVLTKKEQSQHRIEKHTWLLNETIRIATLFPFPPVKARHCFSWQSRPCLWTVSGRGNVGTVRYNKTIIFLNKNWAIVLVFFFWLTYK